MKLKMIVFSLVVLFASAAVCVAQNPNIGTWKLNEAKSKFPKGATKNHTVVYEMAGDDIKVTVDGTAGDGSAVHNEWTGKFDGKPYAVTGDPSHDMRTYRKINSRTLSIKNTKGGKLVASGTITIASNGKTRTVVTRTRNAKGVWMSSTAVYDKQ